MHIMCIMRFKRITPDYTLVSLIIHEAKRSLKSSSVLFPLFVTSSPPRIRRILSNDETRTNDKPVELYEQHK